MNFSLNSEAYSHQDEASIDFEKDRVGHMKIMCLMYLFIVYK